MSTVEKGLALKEILTICKIVRHDVGKEHLQAILIGLFLMNNVQNLNERGSMYNALVAHRDSLFVARNL